MNTRKGGAVKPPKAPAVNQDTSDEDGAGMIFRLMSHFFTV